MSLTTLRIDSRLVHGQVVETWLPALRADTVVVVDEGSAENELAQAAMRLAIPPGISLEIVGVDEADATILGNDHRVLVLVASVDAARRLLARLGPEQGALVVNVGVMHHSPGRRPILPGVHLSEEELETLSLLSSQGFEVEVRSLPSQPALAVPEARERFLKSPAKE